jgi:hypothetical protein
MKASLVILFSSLIISFLVLEYTHAQGVGSSTVYIQAIVEGCGDFIVETPEECDGPDLAGESCTTKGFTSGTLSCTLSCLFDTTACVYTPPPSGGGGGSSGSPKGAQVVLKGRAYPRSEVTILKDAQVVATTIADESATFQVLIKGLSAGTYIFSVYSEDSKGVRSSLLTFPISVSKNVVTKIESIFVSPTLTGDKIEVKKGEPIVLFGQSTPASTITIEVNSQQQQFVKVNSNTDGVYLHNFDSSVLEIGQHTAKSRASLASAISSQSAVYAFKVGTQNVYNNTPPTCPTKADLNTDCRVNLVDFSIVAFWYQRTLSPAFMVRETNHLNADGKVNIIDFSIMAFHWTG